MWEGLNRVEIYHTPRRCLRRRVGSCRLVAHRVKTVFEDGQLNEGLGGSAANRLFNKIP